VTEVTDCSQTAQQTRHFARTRHVRFADGKSFTTDESIWRRATIEQTCCLTCKVEEPFVCSEQSQALNFFVA